MRRNYRISDVADYINWVYFFHAWSVSRDSEEGERLQEDARKMLAHLQPYLKVQTVVEILPAWSDGDDIVVQKTYLCECGARHAYGDPVRIPMLRQQTVGNDGYCLCLSDFIRPENSVKKDKIGVFATSVAMRNRDAFPDDEYNSMLLQTLSDRLAEAGAERLHEEVRKSIWGYAPSENLTMEELHKEAFQGIRPAIGYPCLPDISLNFIIDEIINFSSIGVTLTEHAMMQPHASVSGFMLSHPQSRYFSVGNVDDSQIRDYARRRNKSYEEIKKYIICC
ncbi:MAG: 5-methyltetrahydrofolate--homocysteine methyltransferase [Prevotellaceae bacterium]|nr:5-methyltetrahydrofolate--homocysteine methyltransferase [Candidatus Minthosoma equi]